MYLMQEKLKNSKDKKSDYNHVQAGYLSLVSYFHRKI